MADTTPNDAGPESSVEELDSAIRSAGIRLDNVSDDIEADGSVVLIGFEEIRDAELFLSLTCPENGLAHSMWDRATGSNHMAHELHAEGVPHAEAMAEMNGVSWEWDIVPHVHGRRVTWHIFVVVPTVDVPEIVARLRGAEEVSGRSFAEI
ncbi:hypothetical protein [Streptomyces sp. NPDC056291]|uniref:hypothetical protein n=1 Tax=Streptomyces sp. NPDC056291 TaxID=3345772 RepID=UPI0035DA2688